MNEKLVGIFITTLLIITVLPAMGEVYVDTDKFKEISSIISGAMDGSFVDVVECDGGFFGAISTINPVAIPDSEDFELWHKCDLF